MSAPYALYITSAPGLEPLLAEELTRLGVLDVEAKKGGVMGRGHRRVVARVNLWSGLASHVLVRVGAFISTRFSILEGELGKLPFEDFLSPGVPRSFRVIVRKSKLHHTEAIAERAARAIARRLGDTLVTPAKVGVPVQLRLDHDRVEVSVDTSGEALHRRGYRLDPGVAPLREDIARALIVASGWDGRTPLLDPFAGAGTIGVEAAMVARGLAPGRARPFAFERTPLHHEPTWAELRAELAEAAAPSCEAPILLGDHADMAHARANAERAGVLGDLTFAQSSVSELSLGELAKSEVGAVVTNPPHGKRVGDGDVAPIYATLARRLRELPAGWRLGVVVTNRRNASRLGAGLETAFVTNAGGLRLRALAGAADPGVRGG